MHQYTCFLHLTHDVCDVYDMTVMYVYDIPRDIRKSGTTKKKYQNHTSHKWSVLQCHIRILHSIRDLVIYQT